MNMTFKKIVLILHTKHAFDRKVLDGIASYVRENGGWEVEIEEDSGNLCNPRLSSVEQDGWKIGRECSDLLCRMLRGERLNRWNRSVGSSNLIVRGSCDALAGLTPDVRRAQKFIRIHCREGINAIEVARKTGV